MSRAEFKAKPSFSYLDVEEVESDDEVEIDTPVTDSDAQRSGPTPLSKSAKKKAQREARIASRKAAKVSTRTPDATSPQNETPPVAPSSEPVAEPDTTSPPSEPAEVPVVTVSPPSVPPPIVTSARPAAQAPFSPNLPPHIPQPISPGLGPRKRKADNPIPSEPLPKESKVELEVRKDEQGVHEVRPHLVSTGPKNGADHEKGKRLQSAITRTIWTFVMIGGFFGLMALGPAYLILLVMLCQTIVYRERRVTRVIWMAKPHATLGAKPLTGISLPLQIISSTEKHVIFAEASFLPFATNHRFISFMLYTIGMLPKRSLKREYLKQQFGLFCWVHMSLLIVVVSRLVLTHFVRHRKHADLQLSHFIVNNILEGLIWFWLPASLVICNDVFAYIWGMTFGKTPLIKLSPKKTVEGFVGAFFSTLLFGYIWATIFMRYNYFICPVRDLGTASWSNVTCQPNPVFVWREYNVWPPLGNALIPVLGHSLRTIPYAPFQLHALIMATFASLVAPFGGFFASGFKRAFDIKDFGHSIPGHGGMTDRMDCQFLMGMFSYVYLSSVVRIHQVTVGGVLQTIVSGLSVEDQVALVRDLLHYLEGQGVTRKMIMTPAL
ncbi:hypothetical protein FRC10_002787 [Ceratobasidium sp. 414]|nr:hypothetical protein FRC10_002787 [Ceratobasidium sp. 414]